MNSSELQPTYENLKDTLINNSIGRNADIFQFVKLLNSINASCSIALDGRWGTGKTFFVNQVKLLMDAQNDLIEFGNDSDKVIIKDLVLGMNKNKLYETTQHVTVYYDAWANDNDDDPILSLLLSILESTDSQFEVNDIDKFMETLAGIADFFTGGKLHELIKTMNTDNILDKLKRARNIEENIKEFLTKLLHERGNRLVIFIDELDRCKPSYAVRLLERIKHYFMNDRITFVFSINALELQHTIRSFYGNDFDGCRYLDRFFDLRVSIPPVNKSLFYKFINYTEGIYRYDKVCLAVIQKYDFSLREIIKYTRLTKIAAYDKTHSENNFTHPGNEGLLFCLSYIVPIMIGLKLFDESKFSKFINGLDSSPLIEVIQLVDNTMFQILFQRNDFSELSQNGNIEELIKEKLICVYHVLFVQIESPGQNNNQIGGIKIEEKTRDVLLRTAGLLSNDVNFDCLRVSDESAEKA